MPNPEKSKQSKDDGPVESIPLEEEPKPAETDPVLKSETELNLPKPDTTIQPLIKIVTRTGRYRSLEEMDELQRIREEAGKPMEKKKEMDKEEADIKKEREKAKTELPSKSEAALLRAREISLEKERETEKQKIEEKIKLQKQNSLRQLLEKEQNLREVILDIKARKKRKEDVPGMEENKLKKEYKELADNAKNLGGEIAGVNIEEEAKKKHEQDKNDEDYKRKIENAAAIKAENEDFKTERINGLLFPLFNEERNLKKEYYDKEEGKYKLGQGMYSPAEAAGLLASGLTLDEIKSIKLPVWGKIKIPFPREEERQFSSEAELEQYAIESLSNNIIEEAKKETDNYAVRAISLQMIKNVAETGNIEGRKEGPEVPLMSEKEMELKEPEKKPEVSEEVKNLMQEKLNEEISRLTAEFYDDFIMGKLKKDGKPVEIKEEEKTEFIIKRIKVDGEKNPEASQLKKELDDIVALKSGLSRKEPLPEANYLVLNYFWRKRGEAREEIPGRLRGDRPPLIKTKWEENSEIVRELAGCVSGRNIMKEVKRDLPEFLSEPKTAEQFKNELKNYIEKEKQSRSIARIDSLFPPEIAGQINETGELKIGKVILDKEEVIALVSSGCEAKDIMEAKPAFFSDKIKIGGKYFSKKDLESKKGELNSLIESLLEGEFQKKWETRAQRTLEENKIKELFKKEKAKEILGEDFSVEKSIKKIRSDIK